MQTEPPAKSRVDAAIAARDLQRLSDLDDEKFIHGARFAATDIVFELRKEKVDLAVIRRLLDLIMDADWSRAPSRIQSCNLFVGEIERALGLPISPECLVALRAWDPEFIMKDGQPK